MSIDLITATHSDFEPFVGQSFTIDHDGAQVTLVLDNVKVNTNLKPRDNYLEIEDVEYPPRQPFALTFEGPREPVLESQIYKLKHGELGELALFVSPFRQDHESMLYETAFS